MAGPTATSPTLWLKADAGVYNDAGTTLATDGQTVRQWNDQSGNGNHASQATSGNRPTYRATGGPNSTKAVEFVGASSQNMTHNCLSEPKLIIVVGRNTNTADDGHWAGAKSNTGVAIDAYYFKNGGHQEYDRGLTDNTSLASVTMECDDQWVIQHGKISSNTIYTGFNGSWLANGTSATSRCTIDGPGVIGAAYYNDALLVYLTGSICEFLIYDTLPGDSEVAAILDYLSRKYFPPVNPTYIFPSFNGSTEVFRLLHSSDGITWTDIDCSLPPNISTENTTCRDPSLYYPTYGGAVWCVYTSGGISGGITSFGMSKAEYFGGPFRHIQNVDCSAEATGTPVVWSPIWFIDPHTSNSIHVLVSISKTGAAGTFKQYHLEPDSEAALDGGWTDPTEIGGVAGVHANSIAGWMRYNSNTSKYEVWLKNETDKKTYVVDSSSQFSGFVANRQVTALGDSTYEGAHLVALGGQNVRLYADHFLSDLGEYYAASSDDGATFGSLAAVTANSPVTRNGIVIASPTPSGSAPTPQFIHNRATNRAAFY